MTAIKEGCWVVPHRTSNGCSNCCETCNRDGHTCPGCGVHLTHDGREVEGLCNYHVNCVEDFIPTFFPDGSGLRFQRNPNYSVSQE